jgi:crotonobetainyl-CoA:carnitine CoA-transferase CaiB-like acyl-CoA transferase
MAKLDILKGIRVVDITMWAFVPSAGAVLAHWGAEVVKIEPPRGPDPMRTLGGGDPMNATTQPMFRHYNRGKRAITLDLTTEAGRDVLYKLVARSDVFLTSYLPATRKKLGFDVDQVKAINPRIIYAKGTGQGPRGPEAERGGFDGVTFWGRGGLAHAAQRSAGVEWPPGMTGHGDGLSGFTLACGVCIALLQRERTGKAPIVDVSLMGTAMWFLAPWINTAKEPGGGLAARRDRADGQPTSNTYKTKDGRFFMLSTPGGGDPEWADLCNHLGVPEMGTDPRFATLPERTKNRQEAVRIFDQIFATKTLAEWKRDLLTTKIVWAPISTPDEIHDDQQTIANRFIRKAQYPSGQAVDLVCPPILFDEDGGDPSPAPNFGQHTEEVLRELGYKEQEIAKCREAGVIR